MKKVTGIYQFHINAAPRENTPAPKIQTPSDDEMLMGYVQGMEASDLEERFARAIAKMPDLVLGYSFRKPMIAGKNLPGWAELDFSVFTPTGYQPIQVDGEYAHKSQQQKSEDTVKDALINEELKGYAQPIIRINGDLLQTQAEADLTARMIFYG